MAQIHILDPETIDKIAAGEVVERPSSVVKELVENAIDAGAAAITVEAKDGGIEFIRVTDNGCGMERGQLRTAFLRHATSKIDDAGDLMRISSLGFRGEALSSIAAVAKVEVITKVPEDITGSRIVLEGAREVSFDEIGAPDGTTFLVRNLFFNTPVRRKFLKQPATEGGYITDLMEHLALSRPDISFKLVINNQVKFHTTGNGDLKEVIYRIYGRDVANALVPIQTGQNGISVEGYLGKPVQVRSNRNFEIYFINGRFIRSNVIAKAVEEGYKEYLMQHKFPLCVLHITMDTACVDVNVHPTKMDVRFSDPIGFCSFLMESVKKSLQQREMIPEASLSTERELNAARTAEQKEQAAKSVPEPFEQKRGKAYQVMEETRYAAEQPKMQDFIHNPVWKRVKNGDLLDSLSENPDAMTGKPSPPAGSLLPEIPDEEEAFFTETSELPAGDSQEAMAQQKINIQETMDVPGNDMPEAMVLPGNDMPEAVVLPEDNVPQTMGLPQDSAQEASMQQILGQQIPQAGIRETGNAGTVSAEQPSITETQLNLFETKIFTEDNRRKFRIIGQAFETYWLIEYEDKLLMIDQHAAHEKVNYERLMRQFHEKTVASQGLMPPVIISLTGQEESVLKEHMGVFTALGFEIESFGGSEYALRSVPVDLYGCNEREMFLEVLDGLADGTGFGSIRVIEEKIASMSCKAAVKGNNKLSFAEAESLIDELLTLENPYNCPHGRPTIVSMTKMEMDRKFKRIVT